MRLASMGYYVLVNYQSNREEAEQYADDDPQQGNGELLPFDVSRQEIKYGSAMGGWIENNRTNTSKYW